MDMNELLSRHQIALLDASRAGTLAEETGRNDLVAHYARRIRSLRASLGGSDYPVMDCPA